MEADFITDHDKKKKGQMQCLFENSQKEAPPVHLAGLPGY